MTLREAITHTGIHYADAEYLLAHVLGKDRAWLLAHPEESLSKEEETQFNANVARRRKHEPVSYIIGEKEFYGRTFLVDRRVLIPRPSTEMLIDEVQSLLKDFPYPNIAKTHITPADSDIVILAFLKAHVQSFEESHIQILDIGTGSGCIGITLALEYPDAKVICTDISEGALAVARKNAKRHGVIHRMQFQKADLFSTDHSLLTMPFLVISNPPYIPIGTPLPLDISLYEPYEALFAGSDGMEMLTSLFRQCCEHPECMGCILECRKEQAELLLKQET